MIGYTVEVSEEPDPPLKTACQFFSCQPKPSFCSRLVPAFV
jgi:hypothetical protein